MAHGPRFGPEAQTPRQRARVLARLQVVFPRHKAEVPAGAPARYARYGAGELSWMEVRHALNTPTG